MKNEKEKKVDATNTKKIYVGEHKFMHSGKIEYSEYHIGGLKNLCMLGLHINNAFTIDGSKGFQDDTAVPSSRGCKVVRSIGINNRSDQVWIFVVT